MIGAKYCGYKFLIVLFCITLTWWINSSHAGISSEERPFINNKRPVINSIREYLDHQTGRLIMGIAGSDEMESHDIKAAKPLGIRKIRRVGAPICYGKTAGHVAEQLARGFRLALRKKRWSREDWLAASMASRLQLIHELSLRFEEAIKVFVHPDYLIHFDAAVADLKEELFGRAALDQALRGELMALFRAHRKGIAADAQFILAFSLACLVQADNADRLVALIESGWDPFAEPDPRGPFEGPFTVIYHHMTQQPQVERMREWVTKAFQKGKISALAYAGSEDFYEQRFGSGKQLYGTYGSCRHGRYRPYPPILDKERAAEFWNAHAVRPPWERNLCHPVKATR